MQTLKFDVYGMTCGGCTASVQRMLGKIAGVSHGLGYRAKFQSAKSGASS